MTDSQPRSAHLLRAREIAERRASGEPTRITELPSDARIVHVLGVDYVHTVTEQGGDLYLTASGFAYARHPQPQNWYDLKWFRTHREVLPGTGAVYATLSKPVNGESLALVVKFSRVGERVPIDTEVIDGLLCCEFNGPFEEVALVEDLRHSRRGSPDLRVHTQMPLGIYVPTDKTQPSQTGRFQWRIARKVAKHPGVAIDILRDYIMVYTWLPGIDAREALGMCLLSAKTVRELTARATDEVRDKGFGALDMKETHLILQIAGPDRLVTSNGQIQYGLVDFELLARTLEYEREVKERRRQHELHEGPEGATAPDLPPTLQAVRILGVDYVHGHAESTGGALWVVGRDPGLFDHFLPERWRTTPQIRLLETHETYFTNSKDNVPFVWKISRVGERPDVATFGTEGFRVLAYGFNNSFEDVAMAMWLRRRGVPTILPRAIYRTGHRSKLKESLFDVSRYQSQANYRTPTGEPILETRHNYITIWDHWNGADPLGDTEIVPVFRSVNVAQAVERGRLTSKQATALLRSVRERLAALGVEALRLLPQHLLLFADADDEVMCDERGDIPVWLCNFLYLRYPGSPAGPRASR